MELEPGNKVKVFYNEGNLANELCHILAVIEGQVMYKVWRGGRWSYFVKSQYYFDMLEKDGTGTVRYS